MGNVATNFPVWVPLKWARLRPKGGHSEDKIVRERQKIRFRSAKVAFFGEFRQIFSSKETAAIFDFAKAKRKIDFVGWLAAPFSRLA